MGVSHSLNAYLAPDFKLSSLTSSVSFGSHSIRRSGAHALNQTSVAFPSTDSFRPLVRTLQHSQAIDFQKYQDFLFNGYRLSYSICIATFKLKLDFHAINE
jgi:hypothetical protein